MQNSKTLANLSMQSANFVFSRLLLRLLDAFPIPIDLNYRKLCQELQDALVPDHSDFTYDQAVTGAVLFLSDEGFLRYDAYQAIEDGKLQYQYTKMRLTKRGLALSNAAVSSKDARASNPLEVSLAGYLRKNSDISHLEAVGGVLSRLFVEH